MQQAERDAGTLIPYVAHRKDGTKWLVTVRADQLLDFCRCVLSTQETNDTEPKNAQEPTV